MLKPFIQNVSMQDIKDGKHFYCGENSMLIQIVDLHMDYPKPKHAFKIIHKFKFKDWECDNPSSITDEQALKIADALKYALDNCMQVVVHCVAGVSRSGAVVEVGVMMGFSETEKFRIPNCLVKKKLMNIIFKESRYE